MKSSLEDKRKNHELTTLAFTLVELLAVIVILALILIIAVPQINKVIENSKASSMESSAILISKNIENTIALKEDRPNTMIC